MLDNIALSLYACMQIYLGDMLPRLCIPNAGDYVCFGSQDKWTGNFSAFLIRMEVGEA